MIDPPSLVDQYCHGVLRTELGLGTFETHLGAHLGEGPGRRGPARPAAAGTTFFDTQTGFAVRRWCPPLLGLEPHCPPARYLARRRELGAAEAARRLLRATGIAAYLVDTGLPGDLTRPAEIAAAGGAEAHEIVRLEPLAEQVADTSGTVDAFLANLAEAVHGAAAGAVAFASAEGVGRGLATTPEPPGPGEVRGAAGRWLTGRPAGAPLTDPVLLRHLVWIAVTAGRPLQLHAGGRNPAVLADFAAATASLGVDIVLVCGDSSRRDTAHLTAVHPHIYADLGRIFGQGSPRAAVALCEILDSAPFGKLLFSSGAHALPELHVVAANTFRAALTRVLGEWVMDGAWSRTDAQRVATMIAGGNARRVYRLA
ncbi:amidohydrolase [Streptomyces sp. NPDC056144]|uniref:amidohydrolase n=1 Tax=unclassified Streptomyces TaxID=2593676 RepID=UPI0035DA96AB